MIKRLVSLGSVIVDLVLALPGLPERGGDVLATQRGMAVGGAFNVLSAAARLGLPGLYAGPHGTGPFGDMVRTELAREGIGVAHDANPDLDTGWTIAMIEPDGERTYVTVTGADAIVDTDALRRIAYERGDAVYVSGYDLAYPSAGAVIAAHVAALRRDLFVAFDPGPLVADIAPDRWRGVVQRADLVSLNDRELALIGGLGTLRGRTVVVRLGASGATVYADRAEPLHVNALPIVAAEDSSGAGDVHVGATLAGLARGMSLQHAARLANSAAAFAVARRGPATGPTWGELEEFTRSRQE